MDLWKKRLCYSALLFIAVAVLVNLLLEYYQPPGDAGDELPPPILSGRDAEVWVYSDLNKKGVYLEPETETVYPILVWWTPFTGYQRIIHNCSLGSCLFTHSRNEYNNSLTVAFLYYGTQIDWTDLPLPRQPGHMWVLLHEESSKNNWHLTNSDVISLFNITATPSRHSSFPLVLQYLESIERLMLPVKYSTTEKSRGDIGLVMYLHSDCDPPSDRDSYVSELMKYVKVDSYGKCVHNKDLPEHLRDPVTSMDSDELIDIIAQYKFTLAMENAICDDYITEKFWRPLYAGSVPIVKGSPTVIDWAPSEHSVILIDDYKSPKELADYLLYLDKNDDEYEKYLMYKKTGVTNDLLLNTMKEREWSIKIKSREDINMVESFECYTCNKIHEMLQQPEEERQPMIADSSHYECEFPRPSVKYTTSERREETLFWRQVAKIAEHQSKAIRRGVEERMCKEEFSAMYDKALENLTINDYWWSP